MSARQTADLPLDGLSDDEARGSDRHDFTYNYGAESIVSAASAAAGHFPSADEVEREHIRRALVFTNFHKGRVCKLLDITRPTLNRKIRRYKLAKS